MTLLSMFPFANLQPCTETADTSWSHTWGHVIFRRIRSITVGLSSKLSLTERHWNCSRFLVARDADTFW